MTNDEQKFLATYGDSRQREKTSWAEIQIRLQKFLAHFGGWLKMTFFVAFFLSALFFLGLIALPLVLLFLFFSPKKKSSGIVIHRL